ncbi:hypothetical protein FJW08_11415 [Mesorhizobium sp. B3-2-1]|uniref:WapI family immunity protein n=1 Tax=Mesorhizobium sp. B3-2-1 TaxID=2589891 RepID=UPI001128B9D9|nr:hypothetical protein [Mesorhizobium sp. B3-2-1]TPI31252.1 hypothetical protein FJW08_11415 [Mesorhizobium sp. B3-2-1]
MDKRPPKADEPDILLAGLSLWAMSREFPDSDDYWDGNWINILARVDASGARIEVQGPYVRSDELGVFHDQLATLYRDLRGSAELKCIEPALRAKVTCGLLGQIEVIVDITPDHLFQSHHFVFTVDQSCLVVTLAGCRRVLQLFPVKNAPDRPTE